MRVEGSLKLHQGNLVQIVDSLIFCGAASLFYYFRLFIQGLQPDWLMNYQILRKMTWPDF